MPGKKSTIGRTILPESLRAKKLRESLTAGTGSPAETRAVFVALSLLADAQAKNQMIVRELLSARGWEDV